MFSVQQRQLQQQQEEKRHRHRHIPDAPATFVALLRPTAAHAAYGEGNDDGAGWDGAEIVYRAPPGSPRSLPNPEDLASILGAAASGACATYA